MRQGLKLLILAGSAEARQIAAAAQKRGASVWALVSEPPRGPNPMPVPCTLQRFDDHSAVVARMQGFDAVLDASHGFDSAMSDQGFAAARQLGLPFLGFQRPGWPTAGNPHWASTADVASAMVLICPGARVFSAAGWDSLPECSNFPGARLFLRQTTRHQRPVPYDFAELVFGDPPFTPQSERALFKQLDIDTLLARNLGGQASRPKLDAAAAMGLRALLIERPALPEGVKVVDTIDAALDWIENQ